MLRMDQVHVIRHKVLREEASVRQVARELGLSRNTVSKYLDQSVPAYGSNIITAAREGAKGRMLMIVNDNDWLPTVRVSFVPYTYGSDVKRYRIRSDGIHGPSMAPSQGEVITLMAGETAFVFSSRIINFSYKPRKGDEIA
jgi:hypothetical protein